MSINKKQLEFIAGIIGDVPVVHGVDPKTNLAKDFRPSSEFIDIGNLKELGEVIKEFLNHSGYYYRDYNFNALAIGILGDKWTFELQFFNPYLIQGWRCHLECQNDTYTGEVHKTN